LCVLAGPRKDGSADRRGAGDCTARCGAGDCDRRAVTATAPPAVTAATPVAATPRLDVAQARERWLAAAGPVTPWPRPVPVRVRPQVDDDLLVSLLGDVRTPLADGTFDPVADRVTLEDGRVVERYYQDSLDITYYRPLDKSVFPLPPSGWCSWYYYYREVTPSEVLANAQWISENLLDYGARWVQIDDGWQAIGDSLGGWRDWTGLDRDFQQLGMDGLARAIRALGLEAGIWLAPHGQSNRAPAKASGAFVWTPADTSVPSWVGRYLLDPTSPNMDRYLTELFTKLRGWNYTYFKIDGLTVVLDRYAAALKYMKGPIPAGDSVSVAAELFRRTLQPIRRTIGKQSYLLSSWGTAVPGVNILDGARTGGDIVLGRRGFLTGVAATQRWAFLHNVAWYSDPDVLLLRPPMTDGLARSWASMVALTGQSLMANDRLPDLPPSRVDMLKRVFPATDIRPLDLFRPENTRKSIVDLKVSHLGCITTVGVFNYEEERRGDMCAGRTRLIPPAVLTSSTWAASTFGRAGRRFLDIATDVRVLTLVPALPHPVLISTDRAHHAGLRNCSSSRPAARRTTCHERRSCVIRDDDYVLTHRVAPYPPRRRQRAR
jgi:hypothetical protein